MHLGPPYVRLFVPIAALLLLWHAPARAVPSFAAQTGQPCAACHVGAFGPQLRPFGRSFKLHGYTASDGGKHGPPIATTTYGSFTHTQKNQPGGAAPDFAPNDNFALDQTSLYYAGAITRHLGAFIQSTYDGIQHQYHLDNVDIRLTRTKDIWDQETILGLTLNNNPTVQDVWNSTPAWGFPYNASGLAPLPVAAAQLDGGLAQAVLGIGAYAFWNDWVYLEADLYRGLGRDIRNATGILPVANSNSVVGTAPYWRLAVQHDWGRANWELGTYGMDLSVLPQGLSPYPGGQADHFTDVALDGNWQFTASPRKIASDVISVHATLINETQDLAASHALTGSPQHGHLTTARADVSYSLAATVTPSMQVFSITGTRGVSVWTPPGGNPDTSGAIFELAYSPFGKTDSAITWGNLRLAAQYVLYTRFNGQSQDASGNNTLYLSLWLAWHY